MLKCIITTILIGLINFGNMAAQQPLKVSSGSIKRFENFASKYVSARNIDVWLPEGYSSHKKYAVLYMHDGQMLFDATNTWNKQEWGVDETMAKLLEFNEIKKCIVVGIWNSGASRHSDYFPQKPFESLPKSFQDSLMKMGKRDNGNSIFATNIQSDAYLKFIVNELKPFIDSHFSTKKSKTNTFIAGSSMGGLISLYAICSYPETFGGAACLSTHWTGIFTTENNPIPEAFFNYLQNNLPNPRYHKIYFDYGTATLDALYEPYQLKVDLIMKSKGYTEKKWITKKFEGDDHSEKAWSKRLYIPIKFLLGK